MFTYLMIKLRTKNTFIPFNKIRYQITYIVLFELARTLESSTEQNLKVIESISA